MLVFQFYRSFRLAGSQILGTNQEEKEEPRSCLEITGTEIHADCADRYRTDRRLVSTIFFVDETLLQIDGHDYWLWIAYEPAIDTCLAMHLSHVRTVFVCYRFFKELQRRYGRKPIFTQTALDGTTTMHAGGSGYFTGCTVLN